MSPPLPLPLPPIEAILATPRRAALDAFLAVGWRPYVRPDRARRRARAAPQHRSLRAGGRLERDGDLVAVAHVETDRDGIVTHVEVVGAEPADPVRIALALLGEVGPPRVGGGARRARVGLGAGVGRDGAASAGSRCGSGSARSAPTATGSGSSRRSSGAAPVTGYLTASPARRRSGGSPTRTPRR